MEINGRLYTRVCDVRACNVSQTRNSNPFNVNAMLMLMLTCQKFWLQTILYIIFFETLKNRKKKRSNAKQRMVDFNQCIKHTNLCVQIAREIILHFKCGLRHYSDNC